LIHQFWCIHQWHPQVVHKLACAFMPCIFAKAKDLV
jgi:hypothetical protein